MGAPAANSLAALRALANVVADLRVGTGNGKMFVTSSLGS